MLRPKFAIYETVCNPQLTYQPQNFVVFYKVKIKSKYTAILLKTLSEKSIPFNCKFLNPIKSSFFLVSDMEPISAEFVRECRVRHLHGTIATLNVLGFHKPQNDEEMCKKGCQFDTTLLYSVVFEAYMQICKEYISVDIFDRQARRKFRRELKELSNKAYSLFSSECPFDCYLSGLIASRLGKISEATGFLTKAIGECSFLWDAWYELARISSEPFDQFQNHPLHPYYLLHVRLFHPQATRNLKLEMQDKHLHLIVNTRDYLDQGKPANALNLLKGSLPEDYLFVSLPCLELYSQCLYLNSRSTCNPTSALKAFLHRMTLRKQAGKYTVGFVSVWSDCLSSHHKCHEEARHAYVMRAKMAVEGTEQWREAMLAYAQECLQSGHLTLAIVAYLDLLHPKHDIFFNKKPSNYNILSNLRNRFLLDRKTLFKCDYRILYGLAQVFEVQEAYDWAIVLYEQAIKQNTSDNRLLAALAACYDRMGLSEHAKVILSGLQ